MSASLIIGIVSLTMGIFSVWYGAVEGEVSHSKEAYVKYYPGDTYYKMPSKDYANGSLYLGIFQYSSSHTDHREVNYSFQTKRTSHGGSGYNNWGSINLHENESMYRRYIGEASGNKKYEVRVNKNNYINYMTAIDIDVLATGR